MRLERLENVALNPQQTTLNIPICIMGPTAVGKTGIALRVAEECNGEIVGADAFQLYQGLDILTAKPSPKERQRVPHHMVDVIPLSQNFDAAQYIEAAKRCADEIVSRGKRPIFAGGTGFYIRALIRGLPDLPKADPNVRAELDAATLEELQTHYMALDPKGAAAIDLKNKRRLIRAIEVCLLSGKPFSEFRDTWGTSPKSPIHGFILTRDREELYDRINRRVEEMFRNGVVEEVRAARDIGPTASQVIGLRDIRAHLAGEITRRECITRIQQTTRHYAKRQLTWFGSESTIFQVINLSLESNLQTVVQGIRQKVEATLARQDV